MLNNLILFMSLDNIGETDCPIFTGMMNFSQMSCGGTIDCARLISSMDADIAINWSGKLKKYIIKINVIRILNEATIKLKDFIMFIN